VRVRAADIMIELGITNLGQTQTGQAGRRETFFAAARPTRRPGRAPLFRPIILHRRPGDTKVGSDSHGCPASERVETRPPGRPLQIAARWRRQNIQSIIIRIAFLRRAPSPAACRRGVVLCVPGRLCRLWGDRASCRRAHDRRPTADKTPTTMIHLDGSD
jgi:hypothetical protein